jgi:radical SAM superfamily enzyme YgiQ (UPF0313 family)
MRVLFVYTDIGISVGYSCGIGVLSAFLKEHGHETRLIHVSDELDYPYDPERIVRDIRAYDPGLIAFSAVTNQWYFVKRLAKYIRRNLNTPIVVGGHHANAVPEQVIAEDFVDFACKGEGEGPLLELVNRLEKGLPCHDVPNMTTRRTLHTRALHGAPEFVVPSGPTEGSNGKHELLAATVEIESGARGAVTVAESRQVVAATKSRASHGSEIIDNKMERWVQDLDTLPFEDRDIFDYNRIVGSRHGWAEVIASRGCPYACTYCFNLPFFSRYKNDTAQNGDRITMRDFVRRRSVDSTIAMLREVKERFSNVKFFTFVDDVFAIYSRWLADLAPKYAEQIGVPFACTTQPLAFNEEIARLLKQMGCKVVKMGVEAGNHAIRNQVLNRNIPDEVLIEDFRLARQYGLKPQAFNMIGLPTETHENMMETVRLNAKLRAYIVWMSTFMPYPGTVLHDYCVNNKLIDESKWDAVRSYRGGSVLKEISFTYLELEKMRVLFKWHLNAALENECSSDYQKNVDELSSYDEEAWTSGKVEEIYMQRDPVLDSYWRDRGIDHYISKKYVNMLWAREYDFDIS